MKLPPLLGAIYTRPARRLAQRVPRGPRRAYRCQSGLGPPAAPPPKLAPERARATLTRTRAERRIGRLARPRQWKVRPTRTATAVCCLDERASPMPSTPAHPAPRSRLWCACCDGRAQPRTRSCPRHGSASAACCARGSERRLSTLLPSEICWPSCPPARARRSSRPSRGDVDRGRSRLRSLSGPSFADLVTMPRI